MSSRSKASCSASMVAATVGRVGSSVSVDFAASSGVGSSAPSETPFPSLASGSVAMSVSAAYPCSRSAAVPSSVVSAVSDSLPAPADAAKASVSISSRAIRSSSSSEKCSRTSWRVPPSCMMTSAASSRSGEPKSTLGSMSPEVSSVSVLAWAPYVDPDPAVVSFGLSSRVSAVAESSLDSRYAASPSMS